MAMEKEMATHSGVLAWKIPGMGEPGGLPSMGSHRVRHDWSDLAAAAAAAWESRTGSTETIWPSKYKIFTLWALKENVCWPEANVNEWYYWLVSSFLFLAMSLKLLAL